MQKIILGEEYIGLRLDEALAKTGVFISRSKATSAIKEGRVTCLNITVYFVVVSFFERNVFPKEIYYYSNH